MLADHLLKHPSCSEKRLAVIAVVVTHSRLLKLRDTIKRFLAEPIDFVFVFDNASNDGTAEWLAAQKDPRLKFYSNEENLGGAGGFSYALRTARDEFDPDWVIIVDDDGRPLPGAISVFLRMDRSRWDAIGAAVFYPDGRICEMNRPYRNPFWHLPEFFRTISGKGRKGFHLSDEAYGLEQPMVEIDMSSFVGLFLSRKALNKAGLPDSRLFIYGDDQLYTLNMRRKGLRIGFSPQIQFEHDTEAKEGKSGLILSPIWKVYYMYRNALIAYRVAAGPLFWLLVPLLLIKWRRKAKDYGDDATRFLRILNLAIRDGLTKKLDRKHVDILALIETK